MNKKYNTVIFDLDGTLLNTLEDLADAVNHTLSSHGYPIRTLDEVRQFVGNGVARLMELALPQGRQNPNFDDYLQEFKAYYAVHMLDKTAPYANILSMLTILKNQGIKLAIVSNKFDSAVKGLNQRFFNGLISTAIGESANISKKPAPDTVFQALKELDSTQSESLYVGDSDVDIVTARNANMDCISVSWGFRSYEFLIDHGATRIAATPDEFLAMGGFI